MSSGVTVEVCQKSSSLEDRQTLKGYIRHRIHQFLPKLLTSDYGIPGSSLPDEYLQQHVEVMVADVDNHGNDALSQHSPVNIHVYQFYHEECGMEEIEQGGENISTASHWLLPSYDFRGIWDSLVFDEDIKSNLLNYARTTLKFSDAGVDANIITWNKVILLHGPPGTGKTSLCKGLAQKLCIQLSHRYSYGQLLEINSHSLFSKWFSESGKLVQKMFDKIRELIDDPQALVFVLIDEVESLTTARQSMSGSEPSDAVRVVNALLTQLDQIKNYPNVMVLTTSNVSGNVDLAFVDRADIKQYIGPPSPAAIYSILESCLRELKRSGLVDYSTDDIMKYRAVAALQNIDFHSSASSLLYRIAHKSSGLSGRTLRKMPFLAFSLMGYKSSPSLLEFLEALDRTVDKQLLDRDQLDQCHLKKQSKTKLPKEEALNGV